MAATVSKFEIKPIAGSIGAEILGVDLTRDLNDGEFASIREAFLEHLVVFLPQQEPLNHAQLTAFARRFGTPDEEPFVYPFKIPPVEGYPEIYSNIKEAENTGVNIGGFWHADVTYRVKPHKASILYAKDVPEVGGDTMFANQYLAFETLPEAMQEKLLGMQAVHSSAMPHGQSAVRFASVGRHHAPRDDAHRIEKSEQVVTDVEVIENVHPVVRRHPLTGRRLLYVNRGFTSRFVGMTEAESLPLLEELWAHATRAELTCRYRWRRNDVTVWDNCATQHYAINDYYGSRRHMQRVSIHED